MGPETACAAVICCLVCWIWLRRQFPENRKSLPLPPGPQPRFPIGNLRDLPNGGREWDGYAALAREFKSDVIYLRVLGMSILSINSFDAANELLNRRGAVWSDRPRLPMIKELMGWDWALLFQSYNDGFFTPRRIIQQQFQPGIVARDYRPVMLFEVKVLLQNLLAKPEHFSDHLKRMAGAIIMMVTYGHRVLSQDDPFIQLAEEVRRHAEATPGAALVDTLPVLKYLPSWIAPFKRAGRIGRELGIRMREAPFLAVKEQLASGKAVPSMVGSLLEDESRPSDGSDEELIKNCGGVVYSAGADTTATALTNFFLAMVLYPAIQRRAHQELDTNIGRGRLPQFEDRDNLPYLGAILKETMRWKAVTPLGVPHCTTEADEYNGSFIPAKTTVLANISAMLHDKEVYRDPEEFNPDRFLSQNPAPDPNRAAFGFGRRICPGRFFADDSTWIAVVQILHVFTIKGQKEGTKDVQWSSGLVSVPSSFLCDIQPRFDGAEGLFAHDA
ncbi:cytochrome P450 [Mycena polygramma]|nr:cytochrome P450 [Mycena polygramma]